MNIVAAAKALMRGRAVHSPSLDLTLALSNDKRMMPNSTKSVQLVDDNGDFWPYYLTMNDLITDDYEIVGEP